MNYLFNAPNITSPTFDTIQETTYRMFQKVENILTRIHQAECTIKISIAKEGHNRFYKIHVEILGFKSVNPEIITEDKDVRRAIGVAANKMKEQIVKRRKIMMDK